VVKNTPTKVVFSAAVDPRGGATAVRLEFGTTAGLGARSGDIQLPAGNEPTLVTITLNGQPDTTYYWRFAAINEAGTAVSETQTVATPAKTRSQVLPVVALSFAVQTQTSGSTLGRVLGFTRPRGLPAGTRVTVRCRTACTGGRTILIKSSSSSGKLMRFRHSIAVTRQSVIEIRAVLDGYVGRLRGYRFRRSAGLLTPDRVSNRCLTATKPARATACP
jgi:hypothetical protein